MLKIRVKNKFEKDIKLLEKKGKKLKKLFETMEDLASERVLNIKFRDHFLKGKYTDCRECHIEPDWLLIYTKNKTEITFIRSGSHANLFK